MEVCLEEWNRVVPVFPSPPSVLEVVLSVTDPETHLRSLAKSHAD